MNPPNMLMQRGLFCILVCFDSHGGLSCTCGWELTTHKVSGRLVSENISHKMLRWSPMYWFRPAISCPSYYNMIIRQFVNDSICIELRSSPRGIWEENCLWPTGLTGPTTSHQSSKVLMLNANTSAALKLSHAYQFIFIMLLINGTQFIILF